MSSRLLVGALALAMIGTAAPVWAKTFSNKNLKGTYVEKFSGLAAGSANPFPTTSSLPESVTGTETAKGKGNFTASIVFSSGGTTCSGTVAGTYVVNPDGTGTSKGTFTPIAMAPSGIPALNYSCPSQGGPQDEAFTIVGRGKIDFISTDPDLVSSGTAELQTK